MAVNIQHAAVQTILAVRKLLQIPRWFRWFDPPAAPAEMSDEAAPDDTKAAKKPFVYWAGF